MCHHSASWSRVYLLTTVFYTSESLSHTRSTHNSESCNSLNYVQKHNKPAPVNPNSDFWTLFLPTRTLHVFSVVFVLQPRRRRRRRFLFTFLWKTHSHKLSRRVRECREKHPYLSMCVCARARRKISLFTRVLVLLASGVRLGSWGAVCTTSAPLDVDDDGGSHMISTGLWWTHRENSIFPVPVSLLLPGAVFCFNYSYSLFLLWL